MTVGLPKVKWLQLKVRWANLGAVDVKILFLRYGIHLFFHISFMVFGQILRNF